MARSLPRLWAARFWTALLPLLRIQSRNELNRRVSLKPSASTWYLLSIAAALLIAMALLFFDRTWFAWWMATGIGLLFYAAGREDDRKLFSVLALGLLFSAFVMPPVNNLIASVTPHTWDSRFSDLDGGLSVAFFNCVTAREAVRLFLVIVYDSLTFFICMSFLLSDRRDSLIRCLVLAALIAPLCYLAFPAVGPAHCGDARAARNCMPSLHVVWTLLAASCIAPRLRWIAIPFVVLMLTAVIGTGEHYVIDIAMAVPVTVAMLAADGWLRHSSRLLPGAIPQPTTQQAPLEFP